MNDDDQEQSERRDDNYNLNSDKHLGLLSRIDDRDRIREAIELICFIEYSINIHRQ